MNTELAGLVIKEIKFGENNKYITILTAQSGVITALVKEKQNVKSKLAAGTSIFAYSNFNFYVSKSGYLVNEAIPQELFFNLRYDLKSFALANYFCEITCTLNPEIKNAKSFLRIFLNCLYFLEKGDKNFNILKSIFELRACSYAGFMPNLICCKKCKTYEDEPMFFLADSGILICSKCIHAHNLNKINLEKPLLHAFRHIIYSSVEKLFLFSLSEKLVSKLSKITEDYILTHSSHNFKSLNFLKQI